MPHSPTMDDLHLYKNLSYLIDKATEIANQLEAEENSDFKLQSGMLNRAGGKYGFCHVPICSCFRPDNCIGTRNWSMTESYFPPTPMLEVWAKSDFFSDKVSLRLKLHKNPPAHPPPLVSGESQRLQDRRPTPNTSRTWTCKERRSSTCPRGFWRTTRANSSNRLETDRSAHQDILLEPGRTTRSGRGAAGQRIGSYKRCYYGN